MIVSGLLKAFMVHSILILVLIVFFFRCAYAETPVQPDQDGVMQKSEEASTQTNTPGNLSLTADEQQKSGTGPVPQPDQIPVTRKSGEAGTQTDTLQDRSSNTDDQQGGKTGQVPQAEAQTSTPERPGPQGDPCAAADVSGETWLDQTHDFVDRKLCQPAVWFDDFFGDDRVLENVRPTLFISLRNSARWTEGQGFDLINDYRLQYRLPQMQKLLRKAKLSVVVGSPAEQSTTQPGQAVDPGADPATGANKPTVGLRADFFSRIRSLVSIDAGIKFNLRPDPFIRMRYQYLKPFGEVYLIRFSETVMFRYIERFTETSQLDLERKITTFTLLRWSNFVTYIEGTAGIAWNSGISLITQLTPKSAISYDTSIWGVNHPEWTIQNYRVGSRYRRNFYRPWLFFELAPEVTWPRDASNHRNATYAFMATLEVQFGR